MRRIYDSSALHRDDEEPASPRERDDVEPRTFRSFDAGMFTRRLLPTRLRHAAISVSVSTPRDSYPVGESVPFEVRMKNALPMPVTIAVDSPVRWTWSVDGHVEASRVDRHDPPDQRTAFDFDRGERKRFRKRWNGSFQVGDREWEHATPGEYTIGAGLNVADPASRGLYDETTVRLE
jgi:hypothetical protein